MKKNNMLNYFAQKNQCGVLDALSQEGYINEYIYTPWMFENLDIKQVVELAIRLCDNGVLGSNAYSLDNIPRYIVEWKNGTLTGIEPENMLFWFADDIGEIARKGLGVYASKGALGCIENDDIERICSTYKIDGCTIHTDDMGAYYVQTIGEKEPVYDLVGIQL